MDASKHRRSGAESPMRVPNRGRSGVGHERRRGCAQQRQKACQRKSRARKAMAWKLRAGLKTLEDEFDFSGVGGVRESLEICLKGLFCKGFFSASSKSQSQAKESKGVVGV